MSWKSLTCVTVFCALLAGQAMAVPSLDITGSASGGNTLWTVTVTPDGNPLPSSMALELAIEFPLAQTLDGFTVDPNWHENLSGVVVENPGQNPYANGGAGGITEFVQSHPNVASKIGGAGNVNAIFASLGSTIFQNTNPVTVMTFTTVGASGSVSWDGFLAQNTAPNADFFDVDGTKTFPDTPSPVGDFSGDGAVDSTDLTLLVVNWGKSVPPTPANWNANFPTAPLVDSDELTRLVASWGQGVGGLALSTAAVPEPATWTLAIFGLAALGATVRRRSAK